MDVYKTVRNNTRHKEKILVQCQVVLVKPKTNDKWIDEED